MATLVAGHLGGVRLSLLFEDHAIDVLLVLL